MTGDAKRSNGWSRSELYVMKSLAEMKEEITTLAKEVADLHQLVAAELSALKVKAGIWGLIGAMIPTIGAILFFLLTR